MLPSNECRVWDESDRVQIESKIDTDSCKVDERIESTSQVRIVLLSFHRLFVSRMTYLLLPKCKPAFLQCELGPCLDSAFAMIPFVVEELCWLKLRIKMSSRRRRSNIFEKSLSARLGESERSWTFLSKTPQKRWRIVREAVPRRFPDWPKNVLRDVPRTFSRRLRSVFHSLLLHLWIRPFSF